MKIITHNAAETKKIAKALAQEILTTPPSHGASIIALEGNLGSGKTTFTQGFARGLGIKEIPKSPTFVIMNAYPLKKSEIRNQKSETNSKFKKYKNQKTQGHFVHIDCYRIESAKELTHLGIQEIFKDSHSIVLIEWAERIRSLLPRDGIRIRFEHGAKSNERIILVE